MRVRITQTVAAALAAGALVSAQSAQAQSGTAAATEPDVAIVITPHSVHVEGHYAVVTSGRVGEHKTDRATADALLAAPLPVLGVSYGGNDPETAEFPIDWGAEIPLNWLPVTSPAH